MQACTGYDAINVMLCKHFFNFFEIFIFIKGTLLNILSFICLADKIGETFHYSNIFDKELISGNLFLT